MFDYQQNLGLIFVTSKMHLAPPPVAEDAVHSKALVLLLLMNYCFCVPSIVWGYCDVSFWYELLHVLSSFAIVLMSKRDLVVLLLLSFRMSCYCKCSEALFLTLAWGGLQCVFVVFPDHTHFLAYTQCYIQSDIS